jgi:hypothetical protein
MRKILLVVFVLGISISPGMAAFDLASPGWLLYSKQSDPSGHRFVTFVRVVGARDSAGSVEYDEAIFDNYSNDYFGFLTANAGRCSDHAVAMFSLGKVSLAGIISEKSTPSDYLPLQKSAIEYKVLDAICNGASLKTVAEPLAFAHEYLGR